MPLFSANENSVPADKLNAIATSTGIANVLGAGSTQSATFVSFAGTSSVSLTKRRSSAETNVEVFLMVGLRVSVIPTGVDIGVQINGVDYQVGHKELNAAIAEHEYVIGAAVITGIDAGVYTVQSRVRRSAGTGTLTIDGNDWINLIAREVGA